MFLQEAEVLMVPDADLSGIDRLGRPRLIDIVAVRADHEFSKAFVIQVIPEAPVFKILLIAVGLNFIIDVIHSIIRPDEIGRKKVYVVSGAFSQQSVFIYVIN